MNLVKKSIQIQKKDHSVRNGPGLYRVRKNFILEIKPARLWGGFEKSLEVKFFWPYILLGPKKLTTTH